MAHALARVHCDVLIALGRYDSGLEGVSKLYANRGRQKANCTREKKRCNAKRARESRQRHTRSGVYAWQKEGQVRINLQDY